MIAPIVSLRYTGDWKRLMSRMDSARFERALRAEIKRATAVSCMRINAEMRKRIKEKKYEANAPLTQMLKGSSTPLIDNADLWKAITWQTPTWDTGFIGVLYGPQTRRNKSMAALSWQLHEGKAIKVTPKMRRLFLILFLFTHGKIAKKNLTGRAKELAKRLRKNRDEVFPLKTNVIYIPARPWIKAVMEDPEIIKMVQTNWVHAVDTALNRSGA